MKKICCLILALALTLCFASCGNIEIISPQESALYNESELLCVQNASGFWVFIDKNGKEVVKTDYTYFQDSFKTGLCDVVLAEEDDRIVGTAIVFYYQSVPSVFNVSGKNAYITSMYVKEECRRKGIATIMLQQLIDNAKKKGYSIIMLNASEMGKGLYKKLGFTDIQNGMILDLRRL